MKSIFLCLFVLIVILANVDQVRAQGFPYEVYKTRTLGELVELNPEKEVEDYVGKSIRSVHFKPRYSAIRVEYTGKSRPISLERKELFGFWQKLLKVDSKVLTLLQNEYLFRECGKDYWIAVQKQVAAYFPKELKPGDRITLYLMIVGSIKSEDAVESVFLTNEFKKY